MRFLIVIVLLFSASCKKEQKKTEYEKLDAQTLKLLESYPLEKKVFIETYLKDNYSFGFNYALERYYEVTSKASCEKPGGPSAGEIAVGVGAGVIGAKVLGKVLK